MSRRSLSLAGVLGAALLAAGALAGCATGASSSPASSDPPASSPDATTPATGRFGAAWLADGRSIAVVTSGSSSCPPKVSGEPSIAGSTVTVTLAASDDEACTRDLAPRATLVALPAGADVTSPWTVVVDGVVRGEAQLPALPTAAPEGIADFRPSAGWVDDSLIAILTYGSSGCPPTVESVASDGGEITVRFASPPADQICTMDLAPRVTLADVGREAPAGEATVVLSGGGVEANEPIPVLGTR